MAGSAAVGTVENPPSCTLAIAVVDDDLLTAGWIGDSRVYWLGDDGAAEQLSVDDSWATEQVAAGMPVKVAEADTKAHAITRWLGADAPAGPASTAATAVRSPGWALVCSDGLWNYCSGASELAALVREHGGGPPAIPSPSPRASSTGRTSRVDTTTSRWPSPGSPPPDP